MEGNIKEERRLGVIQWEAALLEGFMSQRAEGAQPPRVGEEPKRAGMTKGFLRMLGIIVWLETLQLMAKVTGGSLDHKQGRTEFAGEEKMGSWPVLVGGPFRSTGTGRKSRKVCLWGRAEEEQPRPGEWCL